MIFDKETVDKIIKSREFQQRRVDQFLYSKEYMPILNRWAYKMQHSEQIVLTSESYTAWTDDIVLVYDFLYDNAESIHHFIGDDVIIKYKDIYITLFEMHGQGCFQSITIDKEEKYDYVPFNHIEHYVETGEKPMRYHALETIDKGLNAIRAIQGDMIEPSDVNIDLNDIWIYLLENLK